MNDECINHLFYADDAVIMAPSPAALQLLLDICDRFAQSNDMVYNAKKTVCMAILPKRLKKINVPNLYLTVSCLKWVHEHKYLGLFY